MKSLITTILCSALTLVAISVHGAEQHPNIIFILADDMGYGDLGCYGAEKIKTPNIDRLAAEGILFTDGHCGASTCTPTRYGLMTGRHAWRSWCKYSALSTNAPLLIEEDRVTIASFLKSAGYSTSIVGKWHLGYGHEEGFEKDRGDTAPNSWNTRGSGPNWNGELKPGPRENGFDYSYVIPVANSFPPYVFVENYRVAGLRKDSPIGELQSRNYGKMEGGEGARWTDEELIDKFADKLVSELERLAKEQGDEKVSRSVSEGPDSAGLTGSDPSLTRRVTKLRKPFFLLYTPSQPHVGSRNVKGNAHWPCARFKGTSQAGNYGDVVQELDWSVGVILDTLDRLGLTENTLVIFSSDNGGYTRTFNGHQPNGKILRGGKGDLVEGGIRVPFLAKWPGRIKPGTRSKAIVSTTDMLATIATIIGKDLPADAGPDSYNVLPALLGKKLPHPERPVVLSSGGTGAISIRAGKWKLIDGQGDCGYGEFRRKQPWPAPKPDDPPAQLYNMEEDPGEANNLYLKHPEIVHRLKATLEKIKADESYDPTELEQPQEKLTLEQLHSLFAVSKAADTGLGAVEAVDLFDGKTLSGWQLQQGVAEFRVENGMIIGKTVKDAGNTFLCTTKHYADFDLTFEVRFLGKPVNSGCVIRSLVRTADGEKRYMKKGNVYGPQVEIEGNGPKGSESGNIYGQGLGTDFLKPKVGRVKAINDTKWNHIRILAEGPRIRTWINGEAIADITNHEIYADHSSGMLGLQVHGVKNFTQPQEIAWRNIRIVELKAVETPESSESKEQRRLSP